MPKTGLSNDGILALSTGIVDPGYEGRVASILINFGKDSFDLNRGESFLRLTFHKITRLPPDLFVNPPKYTEQEYRKQRRNMAIRLPDTFLNIPQIESAVADRVSSVQRAYLTNALGVGSIILAVAAFVIAVVVFLGTPIAEAYISNDVRESVAEDIKSQEVRPLEERLSQLESRINSLENVRDTGQTEVDTERLKAVKREGE